MYTKAFEIRWSDLDANLHLGNSSYIDFMSHTRMAFFEEFGITLNTMVELNLGPVVLFENIYYLKEVTPGSRIKVSLEIIGRSLDYRFIRIAHNFYDEAGRHLANSEMLFTWINRETRRLAVLPDTFVKKIMRFPDINTCAILTSEILSGYRKHPKDLQ